MMAELQQSSSGPPSGNAMAALVNLCFDGLNDKGERHFIRQNVVTIGRSPDALIRLYDSTISRKHCTIEKIGDKYIIVDLSTLSGVAVNGVRLLRSRPHPLNHRDTITLADKYEYKFLINKDMNVSSEQTNKINSKMNESILNLNNTQSAEIDELNKKLTQFESERLGLRKLMNSDLMLCRGEKRKLDLEEKELGKKLKEMEDQCEAEKEAMMKEFEQKIADITKKEEELKNFKIEMEQRHIKERKELEDTFKDEMDKLKVQLALFEEEQERLQGETRLAEQELKETKQVLKDCEVEQVRLVEEKRDIERKLESQIVDLTKESSNKDELVENLMKQLKEKEEKEQKLLKEKEEMAQKYQKDYKTVLEDLEERLQCSICTELFIEPTTLNCGHMFCKMCINEWKVKKKICPMCRTKITATVQVFNLDSIIEKNVALLPEEARERREAVIRERKGDQCPAKRKKNTHPSSCRRRTGSSQTGLPMVQIPQTIPNYPGTPNWHPPGTPNWMPVTINANPGARPVTPVDYPNFLNLLPTSSNRLAAQSPDPFDWGAFGGRIRTPTVPQFTTTQPQVPVAAIDLTSLPRPTTSALANTMIDLTTP